MHPANSGHRENLTIPYDIRVKQPNGYFAFVDFSSFGEMSRALQEVPRTKLNGNEIHAVMRPNKRMLREPRPYVETSHVRLHIKDLAEATTRDDICQLLQDYHMYETNWTPNSAKLQLTACAPVPKCPSNIETTLTAPILPMLSLPISKTHIKLQPGSRR